MKENILPEEKLLKLIRKDTKNKGAGGAPEAGTEKAAALTGRLKQKYLVHLNIRSVVFIFFVFSCVYFLWSITYPLIGFKKINAGNIPLGRNTAFRATAHLEIKPFQYYRDGIANRQIFKIASGVSDAPVNVPKVEAIRDFSLVGIISGKNPQAIVQDSKTQKTYYLNKGQAIGEYSVEDILPDKIILNSAGQRYELFL